MSPRMIAALIAALLAAGISPALGQAQGDCAAYKRVVATSTAGSAPVIPEQLLADRKTALGCLIESLASLKTSITSPVFPPEAKSSFLSVTGAIRKIMANASPSGNPSNEGLVDFIRDYRAGNSLDATWTLVYGARSSDYDVRVNSILILGNVIDNRTICVVLDHLYDPELGVKGVDHSIKGQANLLAVVSVVAPWAYFENFQNITRAVDFVTPRVDPTLKQTVDILQNLKSRLAAQTEKSNRSVYLPANERDCERYSPVWANRTGRNLLYRNQSN